MCVDDGYDIEYEVVEGYPEKVSILDTVGVEAVPPSGWRGAARVYPDGSHGAVVAALKQDLRLRQEAIERQQYTTERQQIDLSKLSYALEAHNARVEELTERLKRTHAKTKKAGRMVGRMGDMLRLPCPALMAARRVAEAFVAVAERHMGERTDGEFAIQDELTAASVDCLNEHGS